MTAREEPVAPAGAGHDDGAPGGPSERGPLFWIGLAGGWVVIAWSVVGALRNEVDTNPPHLAAWVIGTLVVHDAVWATGVVLAGWVTARRLTPAVRVPVRVGLATTALLALLTWPQVRGYGERPATPSALPLDYARNGAVALGVIWVAVSVSVALRRRRTGT
jgi:hypothetical protein